MKLESTALILDFDPFSSRIEAESTHNLGERIDLADGRTFRYAKIGASNAVKGQLQLAPVPKTNHHNNTIAVAATTGSTQISVTLGATAADANEYSEGYMVVNDVDGEGQTYKIKSHPAHAGSGTLVVTLFDPISVALTTNSQVSLVHNKYNGVIVGTVVTQRAAGVPLISVLAGDYCWLQTRGTAGVLIGTAATLGADLIVGGTNGSVTDRTDALGASSEPVVAVADIAVGVATEYNPVTLKID